MASTYHSDVPARRAYKRENIVEYRMIRAAAFILFLVFGVIERFLQLVGLQCRGEEARSTSILSRASEAANRCATYAFKG